MFTQISNFYSQLLYPIIICKNATISIFVFYKCEYTDFKICSQYPSSTFFSLYFRDMFMYDKKKWASTKSPLILSLLNERYL